MASLIALKRRIKTARNISKTTKAMQLISASKLKKAQEAAVMSKPYVQKLDELSKNLSAKIEKDNLNVCMRHPEGINSKLYIVISPDKGLCGGLVTNLVREILSIENRSKNYFITIGKKAESYVSNLDKEVIASFPMGNTIPPFEIVYTISKIINDYFLNAKVPEVQIITTRFLSVFTQKAQISKLLPIVLENNEQNNENAMEFEPSINELLPDLIEHYMEMAIYQGLLDSFASEQAARMIAMKNATDNAREMILDLQLLYNKSRQEKITNELLDITGGSYAQN